MRFHFVFIILILLNISIDVIGQQTARDQAIELYRQGKYAEAVSALNGVSKQKDFKTDAEVWNYLGLAYLENGENKDARKALEHAVKLNPSSSVYQTNLAYVYLFNKQVDKAQSVIDNAIKLDPNNINAYYVRGSARLREKKFDEAQADAERMIDLDASDLNAYILKSDILIARFGRKIAGGSTPKDEVDLLKQAVDALENGVAKSKGNSNVKTLEEKLESTKAFHNYFARERTVSLNPPVPDPTVTPVKILQKPRPSYTDAARQAGISGTIKIAVLFGADREIKYILVVDGLGYGLDEQVVNVARKMKFEPQMKDGKPVSVVRMVEYSFTIY